MGTWLALAVGDGAGGGVEGSGGHGQPGWALLVPAGHGICVWNTDVEHLAGFCGQSPGRLEMSPQEVALIGSGTQSQASSVWGLQGQLGLMGQRSPACT